jgi:hypothetical protein
MSPSLVRKPTLYNNYLSIDTLYNQVNSPSFLAIILPEISFSLKNTPASFLIRGSEKLK